MTKIKKCLCGLLPGMATMLLAAMGFAAWFLWAGADAGAAYGSKLMASGVFVAGRTPESVASQEPGIVPFLKSRRIKAFLEDIAARRGMTDFFDRFEQAEIIFRKDSTASRHHRGGQKPPDSSVHARDQRLCHPL